MATIPNSIRRFFIGTTSFWAALGFYRGLDHYDYDHTKDMHDYNSKMKKWEKNNIDYAKYGLDPMDPPKKPAKYYLTGIGYGILGIACYFNMFLGFNIPKELYRIEVNMRGLEDEKNKPYYRRVL